MPALLLRGAWACALLGLCLAAPVRAADLLLDGAAVASVPQGLAVTVSVSGTPGSPAWLFVDTDPGPSLVGGQLVPLGFAGGTLMLFLGPVPAEGTLTLSGAVPFDQTLTGESLHMAAALGEAGGLVWSDGATLRVRDRNVQLAGRPLATYPRFEFVRAISAGTPLHVAVEASMHPHAVGRTADVYVVKSKSRAEWLADPTLTDVAGGPQTLAIQPAPLAVNTLLVNAGTLSGAAGAGLGVGYDVVVDLDGNGLWDGADLIDGFSDEPGVFVVADTTLPGPLAVTEALYSGGTWLGQNLYYPTAIASLGQLPVVIVSHGNGHNYQWYDHIGFHLASYGYVVMSHQNNTVPGIEAASTTTLTNTDYLLGNLGSIEGGVLQGHVDTGRILWFGHSRGGEGVARAYDRIRDGNWVPVHYAAEDIVLISSIAPTDFLGPASAYPHDANYHLWVGGADGDVTGCASNNIAQSFHLLDRAEERRMGISLHGVGHGDFHAGTGGSVATGPCLVGRAVTHQILRGYLLPLVEFHARDNMVGQDFLWRQWEGFAPLGAPVANPCVVVDLQYRDGQQAGKFVIDDFQTQPATNVSSSGGAVSGSVTIVAEGRLDDEDTSFTWTGAPFNGFTQGGPGDTTRGLVIEFNGADRVLDFELVGAGQDAEAFTHFSLRACQATRHPLTSAELGDLTFSVVLRDQHGVESAINIGAWGGGIEEPYQRTNCGTGTGWGNEFETVRIRLTDFLHDASGLDLSRLATLSLRFGPSWGSAFGRLGLDDIEFTTE